LIESGLNLFSSIVGTVNFIRLCKKLHCSAEKFHRGCLKTSKPVDISRRTKAIATIAIFSALYSVLRILPTVPMIGAQGASFSVSDVIAPIYGILLGPYVGGVTVIIGTFLGMALGKPVIFLGLDFLPALINAVALGFLVKRKWWPVVGLYAVLLAGFLLNPLTTLFINIGEIAIPFTWLHIVALIVLVSPLGYKAGKWVGDIPEEKMAKDTAGYLVSLVSGVIGVLFGAFLLIITYLLPDLFAEPLVGFTIGILSIIGGTIVIFAASKLNSNPQNHKKWGKTIIVISLIGIGTILGIVGGIFALKYKPRSLPNQKERVIKASKFIIGFFNLALIGTMMQHLMGNILFETILAQPIGYIERAAYPAIWGGIFFVYPVERFALVLLAVVIGTPLVRVLKTTFFDASKKVR
jgi:hypothetical protein